MAKIKFTLTPVDDTLKPKLSDSLTVCKKCSKTVPKTLVCLNCGAPILFGSNKEVSK